MINNEINRSSINLYNNAILKSGGPFKIDARKSFKILTKDCTNKERKFFEYVNLFIILWQKHAIDYTPIIRSRLF